MSCPGPPAATNGSVSYIEPEYWDQNFIAYLQYIHSLGCTAYDLRFFHTAEDRVDFWIYFK